MTWLAKAIPDFGIWFHTTFAPDWVHVVMHASLYAILGIGLAWIFDCPGQPLPLRKIFSIGILIGIFQEFFQLAVTPHAPGIGEINDLLVDLTGISLGLLIWTVFRWIRVNSSKNLYH